MCTVCLLYGCYGNHSSDSSLSSIKAFFLNFCSIVTFWQTDNRCPCVAGVLLSLVHNMVVASVVVQWMPGCKRTDQLDLNVVMLIIDIHLDQSTVMTHTCHVVIQVHVVTVG